MEAVIQAFEVVENETANLYLAKLVCAGCKQSLLSRDGRGGNSNTNGVKRMQLRCKHCAKKVGLHLAVKALDPNGEAFTRLELAYKSTCTAAAAKSSVGEEAQDVRTPLLRVSPADIPLPESESSADEGIVGAESYRNNNEWKEVRSRRAKRNNVEVDRTPDDHFQKRFDQRATPIRSHSKSSCDITCKDRMLEMIERVKSQEYELKAMRKAHNGIVEAFKCQSAQMAKQSQEIARLHSLLLLSMNMKGTHESTCSTNSSLGTTPVKGRVVEDGMAGPCSEQPANGSGTSQPGEGPGKPSQAEEGPGPSQAEEGPRSSQPTPAATHARSYLNAARKYIPHKEYVALKQCVAPPKPPVVMEKVHFQFHWNRFAFKTHKDAFTLAYKMLSAVGIKGKVKDISFIGRSVLELYVERMHVNDVIASMRKWTKADTFIPETDIKDFPLHTSKLSKDDLKVKAQSRVTILCARNPAKFMQMCILRGYGEAERTAILKKAEMMRASWEATKKSSMNEPEGMSASCL